MSENEMVISNFVSLEESRINENAYVKPADLYADNTQFAIVGISNPTEKVFNVKQGAVMVCEVEIVIIATGETKMMGMSWNGYRQNIRNHFKNGGKPIAPVVIVKLPATEAGNNDAWGFASPTGNLAEANKRMQEENQTPF